MIERVRRIIERRRMFEPGQRAGVAVSGGADSVCLLHVLHELAPRWDLRLTVLHFNHLLRGAESDADAAFVRDLAAGFGLPFESAAADVRRIAEETGDNLEQAARRLRREFLLGFIATGSLDRVALGHTRSDQAETVLFRFLRGSGSAGLAGMRPVAPEGLVRPLIDLDRTEVERFLIDRGIGWREDATNAEPAYARNRIRRDLLPQLARHWNPNLSASLARMAAIAADEEEYWEALIAPLAAGMLKRRGAAVLVRTTDLRQQPPAVARRLLRCALELAKGDLRRLDVTHVEAIVELADSSDGSGRLQVPGLDVYRSFDWLRIGPPAASERPDYELAITPPCDIAPPGWPATLRLRTVVAATGCEKEDFSTPPGYNGWDSDLDWERISGQLYLRNWRPGDRYQPAGRNSETKIKTLFQEARVPLWKRRYWPVLAAGEHIVWAARFGAAAELRATPETRTVLRVREIGPINEF